MAPTQRTRTGRRSVIVLLSSMLLVIGLVGAASATPPSGIQFEVETTSIGPGEISPFIASGPAVDAGLMCDAGNTIDVFGKVSGFQSGRGFNIQLVKQFTCDDGSGDFMVKLQVRIVDTVDTFNWNIIGGTGDYEDLHGTGNGVGLYICGEDCVFDIYDGGLHID